MKNIIIGTAGHVDHGKTALIKALTGIETDRIKEEKKRGITIELGFAYLDLPDGEKAGIIDVPGHEKFVKNMLAGAGGIDLALLVVAADEGFMPQTREHLGILSLLNISEGIIVVTKKDLVDEDWLEIVCDEIREEVKGTFLENAQMIPVSSYTGEGIEELRQAIFALIDKNSQIKKLDIPPRIPVDRIFSVEGFGTVITGTLIEGTLKVGDPVTVYPSRLETRVRNLQVHSHDVQEAYAGQRVAVNLAGLKKTDLNKGDVVAAPNSMHTTMMIDIKLTILKDCQREILNATRLHLYHGARDILCKVDRASMKYSLEARCPILDRDVTEYSFRLPQPFKYGNGVKKKILKEIAWEYLPKELLERPKKGFSVPMDKWLAGPLKERLCDYAETGFLRRQGLFEPEYTRNLVEGWLRRGDGGAGSGANDSRILWAFFIFQQWYERWMER